MSARNADVMLHIKEEMDNEGRSALVSSLRHIDGTKGVICHDKSHLMIVEYDPDETQSLAFIKQAQEQGYTGHLVGL